MNGTDPPQNLRKEQPASTMPKTDKPAIFKPLRKLINNITSYARLTTTPSAINICHLPDELLLQIFDSCLVFGRTLPSALKTTQLHRDQVSLLANICRTCKTFYRIGTPLLYTAPIPYNKLFQTLLHQPHLAEHVRVIDLGHWDHLLSHPYLIGPFAYSDANRHLKPIIQFLENPDEWAWEILGQPWQRLYVRNFATMVFPVRSLHKVRHLLSSDDPKRSLASLLAAAVLLHATNPSPGRCLFPNLQSVSIACDTLCQFPMILASPTIKTLCVHTWRMYETYRTLDFPSGTSGVENMIIPHFTGWNEDLLASLIACPVKLLTFEMTVEIFNLHLPDSDVWALTGMSLFVHRQHLRRLVLHCPMLSESRRKESIKTPLVNKPFGSPRLCDFVSLERLEIQHPVLLGSNMALDDDTLRLPEILPPSLQSLVISDVVNGIFGHIKAFETDTSACCPSLRSFEIRTLYAHDTAGRKGPTPHFWRVGQPIEIMDQEKLRQRFEAKGVNFFWSQPVQKPFRPRLTSIILWCIARKHNLDL